MPASAIAASAIDPSHDPAPMCARCSDVGQTTVSAAIVASTRYAPEASVSRICRVRLRPAIRSAASTSNAASAAHAQTCAGPPSSSPVAVAAAASANDAIRSVRLACGRRIAYGSAANTAHATATTSIAMPAIEWPSRCRSPANRNAAPVDRVKDAGTASPPSQPIVSRLAGESSSRNAVAISSSATTIVATIDTVNPVSPAETSSSATASRNPSSAVDATTHRQRRTWNSGSAAASINEENSTPPPVTSPLIGIGAIIAADRPNTASRSSRMRMPTPTASAAIAAASSDATSAPKNP